LSKQLLEILTGSLESKVPNVEFFCHVEKFFPLFRSEKKLRIRFDFGER